MLDQEVVIVAEARSTQDLEDRREAFEREIAELQGRMAFNGLARSSALINESSLAITTEFRIRASLIWQAFARALNAKQIKVTEEAGSELKKLISDLLDRHSTDLVKHHESLKGLMRGIVPPKSIAKMRKAALDRISTELDYAILGHSVTQEPSFNIYQNFGIVLTADTESVEVMLSTGELCELRRALDAAERALEQEASIRESNRKEALELVSDIRNEILRDKPSKLRIRGALQGLATSIQTIAAVPQAYQLLKGAASFFGLQLP